MTLSIVVHISGRRLVVESFVRIDRPRIMVKVSPVF